MKRKPGCSKRKTRKLNRIMADKKTMLEELINESPRLMDELGKSGFTAAAAGQKLRETMNKIDKANNDGTIIKDYEGFADDINKKFDEIKKSTPYLPYTGIHK